MLFRYLVIADTYRHCENALGEAQHMRLPVKHKWLNVTKYQFNTVSELHFDGRDNGPNPALAGKMDKLGSALNHAIGKA